MVPGCGMFLAALRNSGRWNRLDERGCLRTAQATDRHSNRYTKCLNQQSMDSFSQAASVVLPFHHATNTAVTGRKTRFDQSTHDAGRADFALTTFRTHGTEPDTC